MLPASLSRARCEQVIRRAVVLYREKREVKENMKGLFLWFYVVEGAQNDRVARCLEFVNICGVCSSTAIFGYRNVVHLNVKCTFKKEKESMFCFFIFLYVTCAARAYTRTLSDPDGNFYRAPCVCSGYEVS